MASKLLITIGTLIYGIAPLIADLNSTHLFHPDWTPHSRLHMAWLLTSNGSIAVLSLWLLWRKGQVALAGVLGLCVVGGFWVAAATQSIYGGALSDMGGIESKILGLDGNTFGFGLVAILLITGLVLNRPIE